MIKLMGYSDDVLYLEYGTYNDEIDCYDHEVHVELRQADGDGGLRAIWRYSQRHNALWSVEVEQLGDGVPIPWPVTVCNGDRPYSVALHIDCDPEAVMVSTSTKVPA